MRCPNLILESLKHVASVRRIARALSITCVAAGIVWSQPAPAQLMEPDGLAIPRPINNGDETGAEANPGSLSLNQLFMSRMDPVNWQTNAVTMPATFTPRCSFTGTLLLRGGGCQIDFGWYNVNASSMTPPPDNEIYTLVPAIPGAFSPQAGATGPIDGNGNPITPMMFTADSIRTNPNYMGGDIGFALKGKVGTSCPQTHFSEQRLNIACTAQGCQAGDHWIAAIIYQSQKIPNAYYIAFEDVAMSPDSFAGPGPFHNDGDFNDFVYFVEGITCDGGGVPCDTGMQGVCGPGLTECQPDGTIVCRPQIEASPEKCDALDNDCNGMVDDGDLCAADEICLRGKCEHFCNNAEFPCPDGFTCIDKVCIENTCLENTPPTAKICPEGKICKGGNCVGVCDGVTCPVGQNCEIGVCLDPCDGVTCGTDEVCTGGVCVLNCNCRPCSGTDVCNTTSGQCVKPACATAACTAPQVCDPSTGACVDPCMGAVCPGGAACTAGKCGEPVMVTMSTPDPAMLPGGGGLIDPSVDTPAVVDPSAAGAGGSSTAASGAGGGAGSGTTSHSHPIFAPTAPAKSGCGCSLPGSTNPSPPWALLLGLGLFGLRRRANRRV